MQAQRYFCRWPLGGCNGASKFKDAWGMGLAAKTTTTTNESGVVAVHALVCIPSSHSRTDSRTHGRPPTKHGSQLAARRVRRVYGHDHKWKNAR